MNSKKYVNSGWLRHFVGFGILFAAMATPYLIFFRSKSEVVNFLAWFGMCIVASLLNEYLVRRADQSNTS